MDPNAKVCIYTPDNILFVVILPQILARTCLSSATYIQWCELLWKGARTNQPLNSTEQTGHGNLNVSDSLLCLILSSLHMMPTAWGHARNICSPWYPAEMIILNNITCQKACSLCELMPKQSLYDIRLSISRKTDCELTDSICLLSYFDGLGA